MTTNLKIELDRLMRLIVKYEHNSTAANCQILVRATVITAPKLIGAYESWRRRAQKAEEALRRYAIGLDGHYVHCPGQRFHGRPEHDCLAIQACDEIRALL